jgi:hypothetical protein
MRVLLALIFAASAFAQIKGHQVQILVNPAGNIPGKLIFETQRADGKFVTIQAPDVASATYALTLPLDTPATNGECLTSTTAGVLSFAACGSGGSGNWIASGFASSHSGGAVSIRNGYGASALDGAIDASQTTIDVADGASFISGKHIKIGSEVMLITGISGDTLTVTRAANLSTAASHADGATVGTAGFLEIQQSDGVYPFRLSNGMWYAGAVPYFRPTAAGSGILDVSSNGFADSWIDICGTDLETGIAAFECLELRSNRSEDGGTTYGHVGMKAFGSGTTVRDLAINENGAQVTIGGNTFSNNLRVQASASDAKGITIFGSAAPGLEITNGTEAVYVGLSTAADKYFPDSVLGNLALRSANGIGMTADAGTTTHLLIAAGVSKFKTHIEFGTHNTWAVGAAAVRPSVVYSQIDNTRKQEISDLSGGTGFWDERVNATTTTSDWILRDNVGSRALRFARVFSSSPDNSFEVFGALLPAQRATGSGDAVNDSTPPSLGATARRWTALWADAATITNTLAATTVNATTVSSTNIDGGVLTATTSLLPDIDNGAVLGGSSLRFSDLFTYGINAAGTVKLGTTSTVGHVWTASDTSGNGGWSAPASSRWTVTGSDLYRNSKVLIGAVAAPALALHVFGTQGAPATSGTTPTGTARFVTVNSAMDIGSRSNGNTWLQVADATDLSIEYGLELNPNGGAVSTGAALSVGGTLGVTGAATLSSTLAVTGLTTLSDGLRFNSDNAHSVGTSSVQPSVVYGRVVNSPKIEIRDASLGSGFWDIQANASASASNWTVRDNAGSRLFQGVRVLASSAANYISTFGELRPAKRSTGSGDAVNDTPYPTLGNTTDRWASVWADAVTITNAVTASTVSANTLTAATAFNPVLDGVGVLGGSSLRFSKLWAYDLNTSGTITFPTGAVNGYCWKSDASGNGSWAACGTGVTSIATSSPISGGTITTTGTISCPTCFTTSGGTFSGSVSGTTFSGSTFTASTAFNPLLDGVGALGGSSLRFSKVWTYDLAAGGTITAPDGNTGISATVTVRNSAGTGTCTLIFSGGLLTGGTC